MFVMTVIRPFKSTFSIEASSCELSEGGVDEMLNNL